MMFGKGHRIGQEKTRALANAATLPRISDMSFRIQPESDLGNRWAVCVETISFTHVVQISQFPGRNKSKDILDSVKFVP